MKKDFPFLSQALTNHEEVIARAKEIGQANGISRVVVAAAEEDDVLAAMYECKKEGIADAVLVGRPENIRKSLELASVPVDTFEIVASESDEESAIKTADMAGSGGADVVMKGYLKTSILLKNLLKSEHGLRDRELVSHSALLYVPRYGKLLNVSDGGTLVQPDLKQKLTVIANGVSVMRAVGIKRPKIAVIGPASKVNKSLPETLAAEELVNAARKTWPTDIEINGPLPFDMAVCEESDADMLMVHTLEEGNIIAKTLIQFGGAIFMGVIAGAKVPISLVSRSDSMLNKKASIALAVCLSDYQKRDFPPLAPISDGEME